MYIVYFDIMHGGAFYQHFYLKTLQSTLPR